MANDVCLVPDSTESTYRFRYRKEMGAGGYYISKTRLIILVTTVVALLLVEGLLIGLVARPSCSTVTVITETSTTTTSTSRGSTTVGPTDPAGPWANIRLSDNLVPIEYDVDLRPVFDMDSQGRYLFWGSSNVTYTCKRATSYVIMHSIKLNFTIDQVSLTEEGTDFMVKDLTFYEPNEFVIIETDQPCTVGMNYVFSVSNFVSELSDDLNGLYRSEYYTRSGEHKIIAISQMEATGARETFPCFDEPALKANFTVTLWYRANTGEFALSNMPPISYEAKLIEDEQWNSTTFKETVRMSTYLLALMVCDFSYDDTFSMGDVQTKIYARTEAVDNGEARYASEITPKMLEYFEDYFNVSYPLPKSDQAAVPDFGAGAMENWGLVLYRETYLLYNDTVSSIFDKTRCTNVVAHELAHQWFGNLVSPVWWDDIWLNEGFASYVSYLGEADVQPTWKTMERFLLDDLHIAMEADALTSSHPLVQPVNSPNEISSQFDDISYSKGASILRMINGFMGEENFVDGLTTYLNELAYGSATHSDLFQYWEDQGDIAGLDFPEPLSTILETWTLQMGYPVINIMRNGVTDIYNVTQEYFLLNSSATPVQTPGSITYGYEWYVPFTYKTFTQIGTADVTEKWLEPNQQNPWTVTEREYIIANIDAVGLYRVNYDGNMWNKLIAKLKSPSFMEIHENNRAQLIDDAFSLARPGRLSITTGMDISQYLVSEPEYVPWKTFMEKVKYLEYVIGRSNIYGTFSNYIVQLLEPTLYNKYGWNEPDKSDSAHIKRMTIQLAIEGTCYYGSEDCIANATRLYSQWMQYPDDWSIISNTYRDDVYCAAIRNGGVEEWNFAFERHNATSNAQQQASLRYGMACSKEPWILSRYMQHCIDPTIIRRQDGLRTCLQYIGGEEYGRDLAWAFVVDNWDLIVQQWGSGISFSRLINSITKRFSSEYDLQLLEDFKSSNPNLGSAVRAVDQAIEKTKANIKWRELNEAELAEWLRANTAEIV